MYYILDKLIVNHIDLNYQYVPNKKWFQDRGIKGCELINTNINVATKLEQNLTNAFLSQFNHINLPFYDRKVFISNELLPFLDEPVRNSWQKFISRYCPIHRNKLKEIITLF